MDFNPTIQCKENDNEESALYWDTVRSNALAYPEQDLMLAVLRDALLNFRKNLSNPNKLFLDDRAWFFQNDRAGLFTFESVCEVLGLNSQRIRKLLRAWETEAGRKPMVDYD